MFRPAWRYILFILIAIFAVTPASQAVELTFDGYPSYLRTRARLFNKATFNDPSLPYGNYRKDRIFFVDSTLRVSPELRLGENVLIRVQVDVADNIIWGGQTDQLLGGASTLVNSSISASDSFRGNILSPTHHRTAYLDPRTSPSNPSDLGGDEDTGQARFNRNAAVDPDNGWFNVRLAHVDITLPSDVGFIRVGRQSFDWGLGIFSNGGHDPATDFGTGIDRLMMMKNFDLASGSTFSGMLFADIWNGGINLGASGAGYSAFGAGFVYNDPAYDTQNLDLTFGAYVYPWIKQDDFEGGDYFLGGNGDLDRLTIYSFMLDAKHSDFRFAGEFNGAWGRVSDVSGYTNCSNSGCGRVTRFNRGDNVDIDYHYAWAARLEFVPMSTVRVIGGEFGWVDGDRTNGEEYWTGDESIDGGVIAFSPAYSVDHLLLKHILPGVYQSANNALFTHTEGGVQNARYARFYTSFRLADWLTMKNQWLAAWNNETDNLFVDGEEVGGFIANEFETTFSFRIAEGVNLDFTGSVVFSGDGLRDMFEGQAWNELVRRSNDDIDLGTYDGTAASTGTFDVRFVEQDGTTPTAPGLTSTVDVASGDSQAEVHRRAYDNLRRDFGDQYDSNKDRIWSFQTMLTVNLDSIGDSF